MQVRKLNNTDHEILEIYLRDYTETCIFIRSNAKQVGLEYIDDDFYGDYFGAFDEKGALTGVLVHYWNGNIMMQAENDNVLRLLTTYMKKKIRRPILGVLGDDKQAKIILDMLMLNHEEFATNCRDGLYALDLISMKFPCFKHNHKIEMIPAERLNQKLLRDWVKAYEIEALGAEDNDRLDSHVESRVNRISKKGSTWALLVDNIPVSLSGFNAQLYDVVQIGPVWTPPEHRSNGYARLLVAMTLNYVKKQGVDKAILFTDNPAAIKAYQAIGFEHIGEFRLAILKNPVYLVAS